MHMLLVCDRYIPEVRSIAHLFQDLAESLARRGHKVTVLTKMPAREFTPLGAIRSNEDPPRREEINGVNVVRIAPLLSGYRSIPVRLLDQLYLVFRMGIHAMHMKRPDVAVVYSPPILLCLVCIVLRVLRQVPFVLNLHDLYPRTAIELGALRNRLIIWFAKKLETLVYHYATAFSVPAWGSEHYLVKERGIAHDRIRLIFNWVDTKAIIPKGRDNDFRKAHGLDGKFIISYAGVMGLAQDFGSVIEAAKRMEPNKEVVFVLIGDGALLARWKEDSIGCKNILFLPSVDKEEYVESLQASDICLVPLSSVLNSPAIPGKLQSIMAVARPVVAVVPIASDAAKMVLTSGCGVVVTPGDGDVLYQTLHQLYTNEALRQKLGDSGRRFAEDYFELETAMARFDELIFSAATFSK